MDTINKKEEENKRNIGKIRKFSSLELSTKLLDAILRHEELTSKINDFNKNTFYPFDKSLLFHLSRSMVKHCSPLEIISWKIGVRDNGIMNDNDNETTTLETLSLVNDFINTESQKAMERILVYGDREFDGKILKNAPSCDFDIVCSKEMLDQHSSFLFDEESFRIVCSYYLEYISVFPITLTEFEIIFFYFLLFLTPETYPADESYGDAIYYVQRIDNIVKMRHIDIENRLILAILHLIYIDEELSEYSNKVYHDIKMKWDAICDQAFSIGS